VPSAAPARRLADPGAARYHEACSRIAKRTIVPASSLLSRRRQSAFTALLLATAACLWAAAPAHAEGPIKRWVDERGMVHYGDALPAKPVRDVKTLPEVPPPSAADEARAAADMARYKAALEPASAPPEPVRPASRPKLAQASAPEDSSCEAQWARYDAAFACLAPYRLVGGGVKPEGFAVCPVLKQPYCRVPPHMVGN